MTGEDMNAAAEADPMFWFKYGLWTLDNQDFENPGGISKPFPAHKVHIKWYISKLQKYRRQNMWTYKSRDLVTTKTNLGWLMENLLFSPAMEMAIHRKTDTDVKILIAETYEMFVTVPHPWYGELPKDVFGTDHKISAKTREGVSGGFIAGVSANPAALQGWNCNIYLWDEFEEDKDPSKVLHATVGSGRKMLQVIGVSNPNGRHTRMYNYIFCQGKDELETPRYSADTGELVWPTSAEDREKFWLKEEVPGCWIGFNQLNDVVILMHFTADPDKRADSEKRWRDAVTGDMVNWYEKYFIQADRDIRARQYNLSFEVSTDAPAFPSFNPDFHTAETLEPLDNAILHIGMDLGEQNPAAILWQFDDDYRFLILDELWPPFPNFNQFMHELMNKLSERFGGVHKLVHPDPTGSYQTGGDYFHVIRDVYGLDVRPPPKITDAGLRMRMVNQYLRQAVGGKPMMCVDRTHCPNLVDAFTHGYRLATNKYGNLLDKPLKDGFFDHGIDALTYGVLACGNEIPEHLSGIGGGNRMPTDKMTDKQITAARFRQREAQRGHRTYARPN